jgi:carbamoyltransferase
MIVLGIHDSQDSGAALFVDGRIVAAVNEERLNRVKLWGGVPVESIRSVLRQGGIEPGEVEVVVLGTRITPNVLARAFRDMHQPLRRWNGQFRYILNLFITYQIAARTLRLPEMAEAAAARAVMARDLRSIGLHARLVSADHHHAHAAGAWATSNLDRALVVTVDGLGDGLSVTVSVGDRRDGLKRIHAEPAWSDLTLYYSRLTEILGFTAIRDEGKVNALAAHDTKCPAYDVARGLLSQNDGCFSARNPLAPAWPDRGPYAPLSKFTREEIASSFQKNLEDVMRDFLRVWLKRTDTSAVALAGGLFANVKLNQRIAAMDEVDKVWVFPHMGDGGLAVGGALAWLGASPCPMPDAFLGPSYTDEEIRTALDSEQVPWTRPDNIERAVARLLADGRVVARFDGRMEFGPRALGNRSILVQATDPTTIEWLNARLKRNPIMPFAPVIHEDHFDDCIIGGHKAPDSSRYMTIAFDVTEWMKRESPGAVHVDGTARPQKVTRAHTPGLARILEEYHRLTALPCLINTSFNMHEEPIVCSPRDAIEAFRRANLDAMAIGPFLVEAPSSNREGVE